ncbi:accessory factor UbiK family protein [Marivibrio halodurans]|uniref:Accessory factor UbiK family protein n=1 Tax=Marivibrio halodurans TaxID=2039722 RepID=A0A8J7S802_9PROT|nr:accessory factor UbiK family protein [Marivibrio halodurans]MBP5858519.1 accessory factor UbiK family protein [Marivibrio halodurans]
MQTKGRIFDDIARVANGAAGTFSGVRHEIEGIVRQRLERVLSDMDLVTRDEFEAVKDVAAKARLEQERLEARVRTLEQDLHAARKAAPAKRAGARKAKTSAKTTAKKAEAKKAAPPDAASQGG